MKDWELVGDNLKSLFKSLAELKADMTINEDDTSEEFPRLHPKFGKSLHPCKSSLVLCPVCNSSFIGLKATQSCNENCIRMWSYGF